MLVPAGPERATGVHAHGPAGAATGVTGRDPLRSFDSQGTEGTTAPAGMGTIRT